jgi:nitrite reductase/ring-hydroxylating ferredoxin subunit
MGSLVRVAGSDEVSLGNPRQVTAGDKKITILKLDGDFFAIDDTCTHKGGPLSEGEINGEEVTCPWHEAVFNIKTGELVSGPAWVAVGRYKVRVTEQGIEVKV